jgi:hypothetical protein
MPALKTVSTATKPILFIYRGNEAANNANISCMKDILKSLPHNHSSISGTRVVATRLA